MGRRLHPPLDPETGLRMFLRAIDDHPWARLNLIQAYSGLLDWEINLHYQKPAEKCGWIENGPIPSPNGHAPRRFGLTPAGAAAIGRRWSLAESRDAFLRALHLDNARQLLAEWVGQTRAMLWSLSPFTLPAEAVRPLKRRRPVKQKQKADFVLRSIHLDGLACLKFGPGEYLNVAVMVDPGGINVTWFFHQFRSVYAWRRRAEFQENKPAFPVFVLVAATDRRRVMLTQLWRAAAVGISPLRLRTTTQAALDLPAPEQPWWNERGQQTKLWGGIFPAPIPSTRPGSAECRRWWGDAVFDEQQADPPSLPFQLQKKRPGLLAWANRPKQANKLSAQLVRYQLNVKALWRSLLKRLGTYPLLKVGGLALVMGKAVPNVSMALKKLTEAGLVCHPPEDDREHLLTWKGVALLAAQVGHTPNEYAELRRWPVAHDSNGKPQYSIESMLTNYDHTSLVLDFMVGLRRFGPKQKLFLRQWDHVQCIQEFPSQEPHPFLRRLRWMQERIIPDAKGKVRVLGDARHFVDTDFWLEVDLNSHRGAKLNQKLERYYTVGGPRAGTQGRGVRLFILVARDDEARLQALRRRLRALNQQYHTQLAVWLTRIDLLEDKWGRLDPTRPAWRTLESSQFVSAFNRWEANAPS